MGGKLSSQRHAYELPHFDNEAPGDTLSNRKRRAVSSQAAILHQSSHLQHAREQQARSSNKKGGAVIADFDDGPQTTQGVSYCYKGVDGLVIGAQQQQALNRPLNINDVEFGGAGGSGGKVRRSSAGDALVSSTSRVKYGAAAAAAAAVAAARQQQKSTSAGEDGSNVMLRGNGTHTLLIMPSAKNNMPSTASETPTAELSSAKIPSQQQKLEMVLNTQQKHHIKANNLPSSSASSALSSTDHSVSASSPSSLVVSEEETELHHDRLINNAGEFRERMVENKIGEVSDATHGSQAQAAAIIENGDKDVLEVAATKIQAAFRGHLARKSLKEQGRLPSTRTLPSDQLEGNDLLGNGSADSPMYQQQHSTSSNGGGGGAHLNVPQPDFVYRQNHRDASTDHGSGSDSGHAGAQHFSPSSAATTTTSTAAVYNDEALR